jgi:hypothetical protein
VETGFGPLQQGLPQSEGRFVRLQDIEFKKGGHFSLLWVKRLLKPGRLGRGGSACG